MPDSGGTKPDSTRVHCAAQNNDNLTVQKWFVSGIFRFNIIGS